MFTALRPTAIFLIIICSLAFSLLGGCGSNTVRVCNATGCCGPADLCVAPRYLFADGLNGQISSFSINADGTLGSPTSISGPTQSLGMAALSNQFLFASNPVMMSGGAIDAWSINLGSGALTPVNGSPFIIGPFSLASGLAVNQSAQVLYAADAGKIDALQIGATGALTTLAGSPFRAGSGLYVTVDPQDRFAFSSDSTPPGNVWAFTADSTGALTAVTGSPFAADPNSTTSTNPSQIVVDSTGSFVFVALTATNQVAAFSIAPSTGVLTAVQGSPFPAGKGPLGLTTVNNLLYVANSMDGTVSGYTINATTGALTAAQGSPFPIPAGALTTDIPGALLYASSAQGMLVFSINVTTGALTQMGSPVASAGATVLTYIP